MSEAAVFPKIALAGAPNCGKTALFNALTGSRQKVANYPGVTVERKEGLATGPDGRGFMILDLPGTYSLDARTPDEEITRDVLLGTHSSEKAPETIIAVADATNLERNLGLILELRSLGRRTVLALNMMDLAEQRGLHLDLDVLSRELGVPVIPTVATKKRGLDTLLEAVSRLSPPDCIATHPAESVHRLATRPEEIRARFKEADRILKIATLQASGPSLWTEKLDRMATHPVWGPFILLIVLALVFQAVFTWATYPMDLIQSGVSLLSVWLSAHLADGPLTRLLVDGVIAGVGSVLVFLPQIILLYAFILLLEDSGYMARAAFLMDRLMGRVGLHGRAFIPLLSSFACAIPGIMATRTIENRRDRLITILVAPLMTCSARLPVYTLLIAAFIPAAHVGPFGLQGLVMLGLYIAGIFSGLAVAFVMKKTALRGATPPLLLELPTYKMPNWPNLLLGLKERVNLFIRRVGTVILSISVLLWFLASYPKPPPGAVEPPIHYSYAGKLGHVIAPVLRPIGFNWEIGVALIPGFAAREVMIGALGTVYAVQASSSGSGKAKIETEEKLKAALPRLWGLSTALSLLVWYIFAPQCFSTLAVTRRETNSWRWPAVMLIYLTALAYLAAFLTYHIAMRLGAG